MAEPLELHADEAHELGKLCRRHGLSENIGLHLKRWALLELHLELWVEQALVQQADANSLGSLQMPQALRVPSLYREFRLAVVELMCYGYSHPANSLEKQLDGNAFPPHGI